MNVGFRGEISLIYQLGSQTPESKLCGTVALISLESGFLCNNVYLHLPSVEWMTGWWFQIFFIFTPTWGNDPI